LPSVPALREGCKSCWLLPLSHFLLGATAFLEKERTLPAHFPGESGFYHCLVDATLPAALGTTRDSGKCSLSPHPLRVRAKGRTPKQRSIASAPIRRRSASIICR